MATNDFIGFASNGNANVMSQTDYAAAVEQGNGVQPGMASSALANKVWRQGANMAAALGRIAAARGYDALDNGDLNALQSSIDDAVSVGTFNKMFFSQTSGTFIAPRTGVYRITLKGGGGGGSGADNTIQWTGAGGGEGGTLVFYTQLTKDAVYPYVIGAGGAAGTNKLNASGTAGDGGGGGTTSFNSAYSVSGAGASYHAGTSTRGGAGGRTYTVPAGTTAHFIPGASGTGGLGYYGKPDGSGTDTLVNSLGYSVGGGNGGGFYDSPAVYGGGGGGGRGTTQPSAGGAGYILIEYAG